MAASPIQQEADSYWGQLVGSSLACLVLGAMVGAFLTHLYHLKKEHGRKVPSSPHYLSVKPNHYVTVPTTTWKKVKTHQTILNDEEDQDVVDGRKVPSTTAVSTPTATLSRKYHSLKRQHSHRYLLSIQSNILSLS